MEQQQHQKPERVIRSPIKVGGNLELSGGTAMFGQAAQNAINLAFAQQNAKGGVLGRQLTLVAADNKSDAGESTAAVTKLVTQDKVMAVIGIHDKFRYSGSYSSCNG